MTHVDPVSLEIFKNLFISVAEEMGVTLCRAAYSPNIKERRDYSCACFLGDGRMVAQAAHIPVHLGAMPASVMAALEAFEVWRPGDLVVLNDPFLGGTHLPDITMVSPVISEGESAPSFFVASRAHHADVGGMSPGSMSLAREIFQEGVIIPPVKLVDGGRTNKAALDIVLRNVRTPVERRGDLAAQMAAHRVGERRLDEIVTRYNLGTVVRYAHAILDYAETLTRAAIALIPDGIYAFSDAMDDSGVPAAATQQADSADPPTIRVAVTVQGENMTVDFAGTSPAVDGPINAVRAITESATWYVAHCVTGNLHVEGPGPGEGLAEQAPVNSGAFAPVKVLIPNGSLLDAEPPHAVAGGNVETSQRIVDVVFGALSQALPGLVPAASQGTMNNITVGGFDPDRRVPFAYYETICGGAGASPEGDGLSGVHVHMTNTQNTPVEAVEYAFPLRVRRYGIRQASGGAGEHRGGDGVIRDLEFTSAATVTILSDRRRTAPYGLQGGQAGSTGRNLLLRDGEEIELPGKTEIQVRTGDVLSLRTPGGGGWGPPDESADAALRPRLE